MARKSKKAIRESLMNQLKAKGADVAHFESLVDDYIFLHDQVQDMQRDIRMRGRSWTIITPKGAESEQENPAVRMVPQYNRQMLQLLREMGLTTDDAPADGKDEL